MRGRESCTPLVYGKHRGCSVGFFYGDEVAFGRGIGNLTAGSALRFGSALELIPVGISCERFRDSHNHQSNNQEKGKSRVKREDLTKNISIVELTNS